MLARFPNSGGIGPESLLLSSLISVRLESPLSTGGIDPESALLLSSSTSSFASDPRDDGTCRERRLPDRSSHGGVKSPTRLPGAGNLYRR